MMEYMGGSIDDKVIDKVLCGIKDNEKSLEMKNFIQHGNTNIYDHGLHVAKLSYILNYKLHLHCNIRTLIKGAFLHDMSLYDWHDKKPEHRLHGFKHAKVARDNAVKYLDIDEDVQDIIYRHMWPLNITRIPKSKEAWVVCMADKVCATQEFIEGKINRVKNIKSKRQSTYEL